MAKHLNVFKGITTKVGLKEDQKYKELFNPHDKYGESLWYLALRNFKRFVAVLDYLINNNDFDLILFGGDSVVSLSKVTEMVYEELGKKPPTIIYLPVIRWEPKWLNYTGQETKRFDNSVFIPQIKKEVNSLEKLENLLFVDDEIANGITARDEVSLILSTIAKNKLANPLHLTMTAEDQNFNSDNFLENVICDFYPFAQNEGISNVLSYIVPWDIEKQIREYFNDEEMGSKVIVNSLLNLPSKDFERFPQYIMERPQFSNKFINQLESKIPNFKNLQQEFANLLLGWVQEAINESKL